MSVVVYYITQEIKSKVTSYESMGMKDLALKPLPGQLLRLNFHSSSPFNIT